MKLLTLARDLRRRKARERQRMFVCEGARAVEELARSGLRIRGALAAESSRGTRAGLVAESLAGAGAEVQFVSDRDFASASDTDNPQGVLAVATIPDRRLADIVVNAGKSLRLLVLDGIQEPGNLGTLVRTAAALEVDATLAMPGTVDLWNAKVVRSAVGALFHHLSVACSWEELDAFRAGRAIAMWGADAGGDPLTGKTSPPDHLALVVGNEGQGLSEAARARVDQTISLSIAPAVESLNVAVAAGILLYQLRR